MEILVQVFAWIMMVGIISILVIVHESGHFLVARMFGFQTPVFGIGLPVGPFIVVGHKWGTQFRIHYALLGGYVAIPELGDESQLDSEAYGVPLKPFNKFPIWQRALVAFAGVGFNILFAYLIMFMMLLFQGDPKYETLIKDFDTKLTIAKDAGVKPNDTLVAVDDANVSQSSDAVKYLSEHPSKQVTLHIVRDLKPVDVVVTTSDKGRIGVVLDVRQAGFQKIDKSVPEIAVIAADRLGQLTSNMMQALGMIGKGLGSYIMHFGKPPASAEMAVGPGDVHGILAVMKLGADIAQEQNWNQLFIFTILISMDLAIVNLVPFPALDGGHLAFMLIEAVRGKPMGERLQGEIFRYGMISLLLLMVVIMFNDVTALFTGKLDSKKSKEERKLKEAKTGSGANTGAETGTKTDAQVKPETDTTKSEPATETPKSDTSTGAAVEPTKADDKSPETTDKSSEGTKPTEANPDVKSEDKGAQ